MSLKPRLKVPELSLPVVGGGTFALAQDPPATFTMLVVYRGLHCPICKTYLRDLDRKLVEFESLGVKAVAVSTDTVERADVSAGVKIPH
jgi:peroxiredoxin